MLRSVMLAVATACCIGGLIGAAYAGEQSKPAMPDLQGFVDDVQRKAGEGRFNPEIKALEERARLNRAGVQDVTVGGTNGVDLGRLINEHGDIRPQKLDGNRLLVFISFSMPEKALAALAEQTRRAGAILVLRGLVNGSMPDTLSALTPIAKIGANVAIDPTLFRSYGVDAAPTFVVSSGEVPPCMDRGCDRAVPDFDKVAGNIPLNEALRAIVDNGGKSAAVARSYLAQLEGTYAGGRK